MSNKNNSLVQQAQGTNYRVKIVHWTLDEIAKKYGEIVPCPRFQRPGGWLKKMMQSWIDGLIEGYSLLQDVYLGELSQLVQNANSGTSFKYYQDYISGGMKYINVDGNNRFTTIWLFLTNQVKFTFPQEMFGADGHWHKLDDWSETKLYSFSQLPTEVKLRLERLRISVKILQDADQDELINTFRSLNTGLPMLPITIMLTEQGFFSDSVRAYANFRKNKTLRPLYIHKFNQHECEFTHKPHELIAQCLAALWFRPGDSRFAGGTLSRTLEPMFQNQGAFGKSEEKWLKKGLKLVSDIIKEEMGTQPRRVKLKRGMIINLALVVGHLRDNEIQILDKKGFWKWFETTSIRLRDTDPDNLKGFKNANANGSAPYIQIRYDRLMEAFLTDIGDLIADEIVTPLYKYRNVSVSNLKEVIDFLYERQGGVCALTGEPITDRYDGKKWHIDHKKPWSKGGETTLSNLQLTDASANMSKGAKFQSITKGQKAAA